MQNDWLLCLVFHFCEALAAINGAILTGFEGHFCLFAAGSAGCNEHLTGAAGSIFAGVTAGFAALRLVFEATACLKLLLTGGENELPAPIFAH